MEQSLYGTGDAFLPALQEYELTQVVTELKLTDEERLGLYAALIALGAQRLLLDYLPPHRAWEIACEVRDAAFTWLREHRSGDDLFPRRRTLRTAPAASGEAGDNTLFVEALDAYDEGTQLSALGLFHGDSGGRQMLERARLCLERATTLLHLMPDSQRGTEDWQYWAEQVEQARDLVSQELD
jgi:hypothetical protein